MGWLALIETYPYFFASALGTVLCLIAGGLLLSRAQFRASVLSGLLNAPGFVFMPLLERHYWHPRRLGGWILGVEDALCSFMVALMAWVVVAVLLRGKLSDRMGTAGFLRRYNAACALSIGLFLSAYVAGLDAMSALIVACALMAMLLQAANRGAWPLAVGGMCGFGLAWWAAVRLFFWLWPEFSSQWNGASVWGALVIGVPLGELTWALVFGSYWPLFVAYALRINVLAGERPRGCDASRAGRVHAHAGAVRSSA
ncbi:MAG: hypothetical protein IMZ55_18115 [Acidobacteria bacterium]|nr:hypothetical protein [Acidobacteriota bacterium]